jgi:hypothetical protein
VPESITAAALTMYAVKVGSLVTVQMALYSMSGSSPNIELNFLEKTEIFDLSEFCVQEPVGALIPLTDITAGEYAVCAR